AHLTLRRGRLGLPDAGLLLTLGTMRGTGTALLRTGAAFRRGLRALDGQGDFAIRRNGEHLDRNRLTVLEHGREILHKLVGNLGNMDKTGLALRQRDERAERLDSGYLALDDIPNL